MKKSYIIIFLFFTIIVVVENCRKKSDYQLIKETLKKISNKIEEKDKEGVLQLIDDFYFDSHKRDKKEMKRLIEEYYYGRRGIVINILSSEIIGLEPKEGRVITDVAVSSGVAKVFRKLANFYGDYYRVELTLIKRKNGWFVKSADWHTINFEELLPESLKILKKLMPEVFK